ncbi:MAG: nucleotide sugar dehydrogenase [Terriglobales bacterium]
MKIVIGGGCGHVGLTLGLVLADRGKGSVVLLDTDAAKVDMVNSGQMPFMETGAEEVLVRVRRTRLRATGDATCLAEADAVIAVMGTPVDRHLNPTVQQFQQSIDAVVGQMQAGALLVLRSTIYPGVTRMVYERIISGGRSVHLAFCPERIAEGRAIEELVRLPQIVAAFDPMARSLARELFCDIAPALIDLEPIEAELAKLFTNSWRYLNFAISNQFYALATQYGLDFYRIYDAIRQDYPRMTSFAGAGFAAGPCLLKDTLQLSTFAGNSFFLGHAAMLVNEGLPNFLLSTLQPLGLRSLQIAILGMAFKADSDDKRDSLSYKMRRVLEMEAREVRCTDPYVSDPTLVSLEHALEGADVVVLGTPHRVYRELSFRSSQHVVDVWGLWRNSARQESVVPVATAIAAPAAAGR